MLSKDTGKFVLDRILSGEAREAVVAGIHEHLENLAKSMRSGEIEVSKYVITKGLNKAPHEYPDAKSQPHVQVESRALVFPSSRSGRPCTTGRYGMNPRPI